RVCESGAGCNEGFGQALSLGLHLLLAPTQLLDVPHDLDQLGTLLGADLRVGDLVELDRLCASLLVELADLFEGETLEGLRHLECHDVTPCSRKGVGRLGPMAVIITRLRRNEVLLAGKYARRRMRLSNT